MTESQIERRVERLTDALDAQFMADGSAMTQSEYDERIAEIDAWASMEYRRNRSAAFRESFRTYQ